MSGLDDLYREVILDHSRRPVGRGEVGDAPVTHHELNPTCGDEITLGLRDSTEDGIGSIVWEGHGCSISTASASIMTELVDGASREKAMRLVDEFRDLMRSQGRLEPSDALGDAAAFQGVARYVTRVKCAMLPWVALEACLKQLSP